MNWFVRQDDLDRLDCFHWDRWSIIELRKSEIPDEKWLAMNLISIDCLEKSSSWIWYFELPKKLKEILLIKFVKIFKYSLKQSLFKCFYFDFHLNLLCRFDRSFKSFISFLYFRSQWKTFDHLIWKHFQWPISRGILTLIGVVFLVLALWTQLGVLIRQWLMMMMINDDWTSFSSTKCFRSNSIDTVKFIEKIDSEFLSMDSAKRLIIKKKNIPWISSSILLLINDKNVRMCLFSVYCDKDRSTNIRLDLISNSSNK